MKKTVSFFLIIALILIFATFGVNAKADGEFTYSVVGDNAVITKVEPSLSGEVVIPQVLDGYTVVSIDGEAFMGCDGITSLHIPSSITSIEAGAFVGCENIKSVYISDLTVWCSIQFKEDTANPLCRGADLYLNGNKVTSLVIPEGVARISDFAFVNCTSIEKVDISADVKSIGEMAFFNCTNLASVTVGDGVTLIDDAAFYECKALKSLYIGKDVLTVGAAAFSGCAALEEVTVAGKIKTFGESAFFECEKIENVYISDIGAWCNSDFGSYESNPLYSGAKLYLNRVLASKVAIPEGMTEIKPFVFFGCESLTEVYIPVSVQIIYQAAFVDSALQTVHYAGNESEWERVINIDNDLIETAEKVFNAGNITAVIESVEIIALPSKTIYAEGDKGIELDGCKLKINYNNGSSQIIDVLQDMVSGFDAYKLGQQTIRVDYCGFVAEFEIIVKEKPITFIALGLLPDRTIYALGQEIDMTGAQLAVCHTDGSFKTVDVTADMVSGYDPNVLGVQVLGICYNGYTAQFNVTVIQKPKASSIILKIEKGLKRVEIYTAKTECYEGFGVKINGISVTSKKTNGNTVVFSHIVLNNKPLKLEISAKTSEGHICYSDIVDIDIGSFSGLADGKYLATQNVSCGDANGDGVTDIKDLIRMKKIVAEIEDFSVFADLSGNGNVTVSDIVILARFILNSKKGVKVWGVTFADDAGKVLETVFVPDGFGVKPSVIPKKDGYAFDGWDQKLSNVTEDRVIKAKFSSANE